MAIKGSNTKGFTLVELAIVLVIIGIIMGAVIKGQDLINSARARKMVSKVKQWEIAVWTYYSRKGRFPGDNDTDGRIVDGNFKDDIINAHFINPPYEGSKDSERNTISIGSHTFYVYFGTDSGWDNGKNIMVICNTYDCSRNFSKDELVFIEAIDAAIDGVANGKDGNVICASAPPKKNIHTSFWRAYYDSSPNPASCNASAALVYYFDAKRK